MARTVVTPWRTGGGPRPAVATPPAPMPLLLGGRPLKRWRWVGCFADDVMLCAAVAGVGPFPVSWWVVWDRERQVLHERTRRGGALVRFEGGHVRVEDGSTSIDLEVVQEPGVETVSPHGPQYAWTRKQGGVRVTGTVRLGDRRLDVDAPGVVDDSAGYHARCTSWSWSAGVGTTTTGSLVAWNLVTGLHDHPAASERTVWVDGSPLHVGPVVFDGLEGILFEEGGGLRFDREATRRHRENLLVVATEYEQPFGSFTGDLPHAGELVSGLGVMERHSVRW